MWVCVKAIKFPTTFTKNYVYFWFFTFISSLAFVPWRVLGRFPVWLTNADAKGFERKL